MFYAPHQLYIHKQSEAFQNENGDFVQGEIIIEFVSNCFLHDLSINEMQGFAGLGEKANKKINLDRNDNFKVGDTIEVKEGDIIRLFGEILDIRHTSAILGNYTTLFTNATYKRS